MRVIKRSGKEVDFDLTKIVKAIKRANKETEKRNRIDDETIVQIANSIGETCKGYNRPISVEEIQDLVEKGLKEVGSYELMKRYILYRYQQSVLRSQNVTDARILSVVNLENQEVIEENSNKDPMIIPTQRDYIAGEVSKDLTNRYLLPEDIREAHKAGIIHFHDADYFVQKSHNCDLLNLEDMLQNGTVINKTLIEKPHSFATACNIATQIMAQVASSQYGGQTITLTHLAPFVDVSRQSLRKEVRTEFEKLIAQLPAGAIGRDFNLEKQINDAAEKRLLDEIKRGVQTMQYQINTLMTTNGQTPFVSINMYLNEAKDEKEKADLALIIEEVLKQRIEGTKNEKGVWVTPSFPKLLYVLEEDNVKEGTPYFYLTELAAKCTAKRLVPDYISEKIMLQNKIDKNGNGNCYPCMGVS